MKKTDYSKIAERFDRNPYRKYSERDKILEKYITNTIRQEYYVLDLACGTGNYLACQVQVFKKHNIKWCGLDPSEEMLQIAKKKVKNVEFYKGYAEDLPYEAEIFDFIVTNFAFHHFENKIKALDEMKRVLRKEGILSMLNISPQHIKSWWVYQYFPNSIPEDQKRFWTVEQISDALKKRGFTVKTEINILQRHFKLSAILEEVQNRDISQLNIISEKQYEQGIKRIEKDLKKDPNSLINEVGALLYCIARKTT